MKVSVIVTAFNAEKYIAQTLESIYEQTLKDFELIVVNDGSTDSTLSIVDSFSHHDNLTIVNKQNQGVSAARNSALERVKGDYVVMVDSDDVLEPNMLQDLFDTADQKGADIVVGAYTNVNLYQKLTLLRECPRLEETTSNVADFAIDLFKHQLLSPVWNKLYRRSFVKDFNFENLQVGEDLVFNLKLLQKSAKIEYVPIPIYRYFSRGNGSILNRYQSNIAANAKVQYLTWYSFLNTIPPRRYNKKFFLRALCFELNFSVFKNIYREKSPLNFFDRSQYIENNILNDLEFSDFIKKYKADGILRKFYVQLYKLNSAFILNLAFSLLYFVQKAQRR